MENLSGGNAFFPLNVQESHSNLRLFKFLVMGPATLLLPPRLFYKARAWYGKEDLGRFRERVCRSERASDTVAK